VVFFTPFIPSTVQFEGGFGRTLVNLNSVKKKVDIGMFDPNEASADESVESVITAWAEVRKKGELSVNAFIQNLSSITCIFRSARVQGIALIRRQQELSIMPV
jgi:hypothetical protein